MDDASAALAPLRIGYAGTPCENYGGTLQAYALYRAIEKLGYQCELIGQNHEIRQFKRLPDRELAWKFFRRFGPNPQTIGVEGGKFHIPNWQWPFRRPFWIPAFSGGRFKKDHMRKIFQDFWLRHFSFSQSLPQIAAPSGEILPEARTAYDAYVCGSDQIWNPKLKFWSSDPKLYLQFAPEGKRVSYAPSISFDTLPRMSALIVPEFREHLRGLAPYLSCRERQGAAIIEQLTGLPVTTVLDPVYLLDKNSWGEATQNGVMPVSKRKVMDSGKPYLLAYFLNRKCYTAAVPAIQSIAKRIGGEIIWMIGNNNKIQEAVNTWQTCPGGFMQLLSGASFVCTDGFHGTSLSIIFDKQFIFMGQTERDKYGRVYPQSSRLVNIFEQFDLASQTADPDKPKKQPPFIDYDRVGRQRSKAIEKSLSYLQNALAGACRVSPVDENSADQPPVSPAYLLPIQTMPGAHHCRVPLVPPEQCTGCEACRNICPKNAISMKPDPDGFLYPSVKPSACIRCGRCLKCCPVRNRPALRRVPVKISHAAWSMDFPLLADSSSGGMFSVIANQWALANGGVVFGVSFGKDIKARHAAARSAEELRPLRRSKYVQSEIGLTYREIRRELQNGKAVFFVGTACQVAGLYSYLGEDPPNLLTADVICHGVPSPQLLKKYVTWREGQAGSKLIRLTTRSKRQSPNLYGVEMQFEDGQDWHVAGSVDEYLICFLSDHLLRSSCYDCGFQAGVRNRIADITLGDFWGLGANKPFLFDKSQGVSLVLYSSRKGELLFQRIRETPGLIFSKARPIKEAVDGNQHALRAGFRPKRTMLSEWVRRTFRDSPFDQAFASVFGKPEILEPALIRKQP